MYQMPHLAHQTQKRSFIRCVKCVKFLQHTTVPLHFWHGMDLNGICNLLVFYSSFSLILLWATPSPLLQILLSLLPLCLIILSLVKDGFQCGYILAWALAWVRWRCGLWVWRRGGSRRAGSWGVGSRRVGSWRGGSRTHSRGEWVLMGGFRWGLGWFPSLVFFFFFFFLMWRWWMWVCAGRCCCGNGCWWLLLWQWWMCHCCCWCW